MKSYDKKFVEHTYFTIEYSDFESIIRKEYKQKDYEYVADVECGNDSEQSYEVRDGDKYFDEYEQEQIEKFKEDQLQTSYMAETLLNDMCRRGKIKPGSYLISVCW